MESAVRSCHCRHRVPVILLLRHHGPETTGHFVGKRNRGNHAWLSRPQARQPAIVRGAKPFDRLQNGHRARDQERADVALPPLRRLAQPGFAAPRVLLGHEPPRHAGGVLSARRVDPPGALADEHLPRAKQHGASLLIFRLHRNKRSVGRNAASTMASASAVSFF